jgi:hypothetical protein
MSLHSYEVSRELARDDPPFSALIMAAMRKADTKNSQRLQMAFPEIFRELQLRYDSPGGLLPGERTEPGNDRRRQEDAGPTSD